ncbi:MAG: HNH endonuclease [Ruminiclostridium sp.]|nr:HNH endonuclease [Ruminiclostridium sp.]
MSELNFGEIFSKIGSELLEKSKQIEKVGDINELDKPIAKFLDINEIRRTDPRECPDVDENMSGCPIEGHGGHWDGERGNSTWYPDKDEVPKNPKTNPDGLTWGQILDKYGIDGIPFKNGQPDFSEVSKGTVEIDNFSENRYGKGGNFDQACEKLAEQRGCTKEEVKQWMKENKYTWHEGNDCKTMDKVPTEVHGNVRHEGGISEMKKNQTDNASNEEKT